MTTLLDASPGITAAQYATRSTLAPRALEALLAAQMPDATDQLQIEERAVYRPDSWLIQQCWEALADAGAATEALTVARIAAPRQPLTLVQMLHRLSRQIDRKLGLAALIAQELRRLQPEILAVTTLPDDVTARDRLLFAAATAATIGDTQLAFTFLERLDQFAAPWERPIVTPEQRQMLADTWVRLGLHPLSIAVITNALRRYNDAGAQFVLSVTTAISEQLRRPITAPRMARLLALGVDTFRHATLTSLHARRLTAIALAQAGAIDEVLEQLTAVANIQAARRESGLSLRRGDQNLLRQVKRPTADADIDFQVYTMQEAVRAMPVRQMSREARIELANRLAALGTQSDGWTAAGAATTLIELGAVKFAVDVVESIPAKDPTKAEGYIGLVRGLLIVEEPTLAEEQIEKGLAWAHTYPGRNPERALIWGLAQLYLERGQPDKALAILSAWREPTGFWRSVRNFFDHSLNDDDLRGAGLRLRAVLQQDTPDARNQATLKQQVAILLTWAPRLLDGEALVNFLVDNLLAPLLISGRTQLALSVLPVLQSSLRARSGEKHAARLTSLSQLLVNELGAEFAQASDVGNGAGNVRAAVEQFIVAVWQHDSQRGLWQTVHGIEGLLPLLIALDGPDAVVGLARSVEQAGRRWGE
jgi:tetratricopeptide (TPR) repeat protein